MVQFTGLIMQLKICRSSVPVESPGYTLNASLMMTVPTVPTKYSCHMFTRTTFVNEKLEFKDRPLPLQKCEWRSVL